MLCSIQQIEIALQRKEMVRHEILHQTILFRPEAAASYRRG